MRRKPRIREFRISGYGLAIGAIALSLANAASIVFSGTCLALKLIKEKQGAVRTENKRLRIAIDMDETIADSLKEHLRRYNLEFAEKVTVEDLLGKHLETTHSYQTHDPGSSDL